MPFSFRDFCDKAKDISLFLNEVSSICSSAMSLINVDSGKDWSIDICDIACLILQFSNVFVRMKWNNSIIVITSRDKHGWILLFLDIVKWGPVDQEVEWALLIRIAILWLPEVTTCELVESEHVCNWNLWNCTRQKIRSLVSRCSNQGTSIWAS